MPEHSGKDQLDSVQQVSYKVEVSQSLNL
jgi:hypothetical protein